MIRLLAKSKSGTQSFNQSWASRRNSFCFFRMQQTLFCHLTHSFYMWRESCEASFVFCVDQLQCKTFTPGSQTALRHIAHFIFLSTCLTTKPPIYSPRITSRRYVFCLLGLAVSTGNVEGLFRILRFFCFLGCCDGGKLGKMVGTASVVSCGLASPYRLVKIMKTPKIRTGLDNKMYGP